MIMAEKPWRNARLIHRAELQGLRMQFSVCERDLKFLPIAQILYRVCLGGS